MNIRRYEIYFADLNPSIGAEIEKVRPVVVVSKTLMNRYLDTVVICPLTTRLHPEWRSRIQIKCAGKNAEISVDQIRAIGKKRLKDKIDELSAEDALTLRSLIIEMYGE